MKVTIKNIVEIARLYKVARADEPTSSFDQIHHSNPTPTSTLTKFRYKPTRTIYYILHDDTAEDDRVTVESRLPSTIGELLHNPLDSSTTNEDDAHHIFATPYHGKDVYVFQTISDKVRLDAYLVTQHPDVSRSTWQRHIKKGHISVNGSIETSPSSKVSAGDTVAIDVPETLDFSEHTLPVLYMDDDVVVINKPAGILSHAKGNDTEEFSVADFMRRYTTFGLDTNRPGIIHRLDRDTSGIMICARTPKAAITLQKQFADRKTIKQYSAVTKGIPKIESATIDLPIGRVPSAPSTYRVDSNGRPSTTQYTVVSHKNGRSLIDLTPITGRTHQLRVHLAYIGCPIIGDKLYSTVKTDRMYLHARRLTITLPDGIKKTFQASVPKKFLAYGRELRD